MRGRVPVVVSGVIVVGILVTSTAAAERKGRGRTPPYDLHAARVDRNGERAGGTALFSDTGEPMGTFYPMSRDLKRWGGVAVDADPDAACRAEPGSAYCNSLSPGWWQPPLDNPDVLVADDAALASVARCELDRYVLKVNGSADGQGEGPYSIDAALYASCPGAGGATPIPGTECHQDLEDSGAALVVCEAAPGTILPTNNLWVGIKFSRLHCAVAVGALATKGFSADLLDFPGFACRANLGGFYPDRDFGDYGNHASFFLEIYTNGHCADPSSDPPTEAFPNYKSSSHALWSYTPGSGIRFADDISLREPQCWMTSMEVAVKGPGITHVDLRVGLNNVDPVHGGVIPGADFFVIGGSGLVIGRRDFDPPLLLTQPDLWIGYHTTSTATGPIITDRAADLGRNEDLIWVHDGTRWQAGPLDDGRYAATDVTIFCADSPPKGACCDMIFTDDHACVGGDNDGQPCAGNVDCPEGRCIGDSVCRDDLAPMNCATGNLPALWSRGESCEGVCVGGDSDGLSCARQVDCPGHRCYGGYDDGMPCDSDEDCDWGHCRRAECDGPFIRSCGVSACCPPDCECRDVTEQECFELPPIGDMREFQLGGYCGLAGQRCRAGCWACATGGGPCCEPHGGLGCEDPFCCHAVCDEDAFCCLVAWDATCANLARSLCDCGVPANDNCSGEGLDGAQILTIPGLAIADVEFATEAEDDPGFACHSDEPGTQGVGTVWYKFFGPEPATTQDVFSSVKLSTCLTNSPNGRDSLIQVFTMPGADEGACDDGSTCSIQTQDCVDGSVCWSTMSDEQACGALIPIACSDDVGPDQGCPRTRNSRICLPNVVPGHPYYVMLAAKNEENRDTYRLDVTQGCTIPTPLPNDFCHAAEQLEGGLREPLVIPFDLSGGGEHTSATMDLDNPQDILGNLKNDIWYDWTAPTSGQVTIGTCDRSISDPLEQVSTGLIVYEGCDCPFDDTRAVAFSDFCGGECGPSACVTFEVIAGRCYKIRLGGHFGSTPAGELRISLTSEECSDGPITLLDPLSGTVDARAPHKPSDSNVSQGVRSILVSATSGTGDELCWSLCETATNGPANDILGIVDNGDGTLTVILDRPITPGAVTTLTYVSFGGVAQTGVFIAHPGNVNGDGIVDADDLAAMVKILNGSETPAHGLYSADCNHSGKITPADLLCVLNLLNGGDAYAPGWNGTSLPTAEGCLPATESSTPNR